MSVSPMQVKRIERKKNGSIKRVVVPERATQAHILAYLQTNGFFCWRNNSGFHRCNAFKVIRLSPAGSPDIIGILPDGKFFGVEVKTEIGKQNERQVYFQQEMAKLNAIYILAKSVSDVVQRLKELNYVSH